jgi:hypothetical protein
MLLTVRYRNEEGISTLDIHKTSNSHRVSGVKTVTGFAIQVFIFVATVLSFSDVILEWGWVCEWLLYPALMIQNAVHWNLLFRLISTHLFYLPVVSIYC